MVEWWLTDPHDGSEMNGRVVSCSAVDIMSQTLVRHVNTSCNAPMILIVSDIRGGAPLPTRMLYINFYSKFCTSTSGPWHVQSSVFSTIGQNWLDAAASSRVAGVSHMLSALLSRVVGQARSVPVLTWLGR